MHRKSTLISKTSQSIQCGRVHSPAGELGPLHYLTYDFFNSTTSWKEKRGEVGVESLGVLRLLCAFCCLLLLRGEPPPPCRWRIFSKQTPPFVTPPLFKKSQLDGRQRRSSSGTCQLLPKCQHIKFCRIRSSLILRCPLLSIHTGALRPHLLLPAPTILSP